MDISKTLTSPPAPGAIFKYTPKSSLVTHTVPDIREDSIILGVCGISDIDNADPEVDGWFFSDFFAFNYLLRGLGATQVWLTAIDPLDLVQRYQEYLHGNPFLDRKVVLNRDLLERDEIGDITVTTSSELLNVFLHTLRAKCDQARAKGQPVIVFVFGHGHEITKGVNLGTEGHCLEIDAFRTSLGEDVAVTLISTACFSGGWSVHPYLKASTTTAAGPEVESESWGASDSIGRYCGSIYATALIQSLSDISSPLVKRCEARHETTTGSLQPELPNQLQTETYNEFACTIHKTLLNRVDRFGDKHEINFSAQDDDWESSWTGRTGIPLRNFSNRWDQLLTRPSTMTSSSLLNRDPAAAGITGTIPSLSPGDIKPFHAGRLGSLFGGTARTQGRYVKNLAKEFLQMCPGFWTLGYGPSLHGTLRKFIRQPGNDPVKTAEIFCLLEYRFSMMLYAEYLLTKVAVPPPNDTRCHNWYKQEWMATSPRRMGFDSQDLHRRIVQLLEERKIFPEPTKEQGRKFYHPRDYVAAALVEVGVDIMEAQVKVNSMAQVRDQTIQEQQEAIIRIPSVRRLGRKWLESVTRTLRDLSPRKRIPA